MKGMRGTSIKVYQDEFYPESGGTLDIISLEAEDNRVGGRTWVHLSARGARRLARMIQLAAKGIEK